MKKTLVVVVVSLLALIALTSPVLAFSEIEFFISDSLNNEPWGTSSGQSYRIYISGSSSGELLDTGTLTTPGDPVLDFTCAYGSACPPGSGTTLGTPSSGETVTIYIILTGTEGNPETITASFDQPPVDLGTFTVNRETGTGPNAVTFTNVAAHSPNVWLPVGVVAGVSMLAMGALIVIRKRR